MSFSRIINLYLNTDAQAGRCLVSGLLNIDPLATQQFVQGDTFVCRIWPRSQTGNVSTPLQTVRLATGTNIVLAGKKSDALGSTTLLYSANAWTEYNTIPADNTGDWYYECALNLNTSELATAMASLSSTATSLTTRNDIELQNADNTQRLTYQFDSGILRQVYSGESNPTPGTPDYPLPSALLLAGMLATQGQAEAGSGDGVMTSHRTGQAITAQVPALVASVINAQVPAKVLSTIAASPADARAAISSDNFSDAAIFQAWVKAGFTVDSTNTGTQPCSIYAQGTDTPTTPLCTKNGMPMLPDACAAFSYAVGATDYGTGLPLPGKNCGFMWISQPITAATAEQVDAILVALVENGKTGGLIHLEDQAVGPYAPGFIAKATLESRSWQVYVLASSEPAGQGFSIADALPVNTSAWPYTEQSNLAPAFGISNNFYFTSYGGHRWADSSYTTISDPIPTNGTPVLIGYGSFDHYAARVDGSGVPSAGGAYVGILPPGDTAYTILIGWGASSAFPYSSTTTAAGINFVTSVFGGTTHISYVL